MKDLKHIFSALIFALCFGGLLTACSENLDDDDDVEFADWQTRNDAYFAERMAEARAAIATAKAQYGDAWEDHCDYRIYRNYSIGDAYAATSADSIVVLIEERGTGSGCPMYTDSVGLNYIGRLMPSDSYSEGKIFDHSGYTVYESDIFNAATAHPTSMLVSNTVSGMTTALMRMHIGDKWKVFIPYNLGYGAASTTAIPAYSTLIFRMQLASYFRAGTSVSEN